MADNVVLDPGSGGATIATDEQAGDSSHVQWFKLMFGANGTFTIVEATVGLPVNVVAALPAGTNNIGDVDVLSIVPGTGATNLGKAVDTATGATDTGVLSLFTRDDALSTLTPIEGDNVQGRVDADGALWVHPTTAGATTLEAEYVDETAFTTGTSSLLAIGAHNLDGTSPLDIAAGEVGVLRMSPERQLHIEIRDGAGNERGANVDASSQLAVADAAAAALLGTIDADTSGIITAVQLIDDAIFTDDAAYTPGTSKLMMIGAEYDNAAIDSVDEGDAGALRMSAKRSLHVEIRDSTANERGANVNSSNQLSVSADNIAAGTNLIGDVGIQGRTTGGLSMFHSIDLDETSEQVKATAGTVYAIVAFNRTAAPLYLRFYDHATPTVGTTAAVLVLVVPGNADSDGAGFVWSIPQGLAFATAISAAVTTGVAANDASAPGANECVVNVAFK